VVGIAILNNESKYARLISRNDPLAFASELKPHPTGKSASIWVYQSLMNTEGELEEVELRRLVPRTFERRLNAA
jgi:hypothetical protein